MHAGDGGPQGLGQDLVQGLEKRGTHRSFGSALLDLIAVGDEDGVALSEGRDGREIGDTPRYVVQSLRNSGSLVSIKVRAV